MSYLDKPVKQRLRDKISLQNSPPPCFLTDGLPLGQGSATYGSRAICGSFDGCIWLARKICYGVFF